MHTKHTTEGIVLSGFDTGETNRVVKIFTRKFGVVYAHAQGVRRLKSKLRYSLTPFSCGSYSFVRGRRGWILTNASSRINFYSALFDKDRQRLVCVRIISLLERLVQGEERHEKLFDVCKNALDKLSKERFSKKSLSHLEILTALRILFHLGYMGDPALPGDIKESSNLTNEVLKLFAPHKDEALQSINSALRESHL